MSGGAHPDPSFPCGYVADGRRSRTRSPAPRWLLLAALVATLAGCATGGPPPGRMTTYAHPVPPDVTFDLRRAEALTPEQADAQLARTRLLFLGEHHTEPRSHAYQRDVLARLADSGRPLVVALEMFPPEADPVLEDWRQGRIDALTFLERSDWYQSWGFAWAHYRGLFELFRERHIALRGVNASRDVREAVRQDKAAELPADVRALLGDLDAAVPAHEAYVRDALRDAGHNERLVSDPAVFRRYYRVQRMWDRVMGVRTARLAAEQPDDGIAVLIVGAGHVAHGLGANLQAARTTVLPTLSVWDAVVPPAALDAQGRYPVPVGMADWVRVYVGSDDGPEYPSLAAVRLEEAPGGVRVAAVGGFGGPALQQLRAGDVVQALNGTAPRSPTALRLAYEQVPPGSTARFTIEREGRQLTVEIDPHAQEH